MAATARPIEQVYERAMELSDEERLLLADLLYASATEDEDLEWDAATESELDEIEAAMASGEMPTYTLDEVRQMVRDKLDGKRDSLL